MTRRSSSRSGSDRKRGDGKTGSGRQRDDLPSKKEGKSSGGNRYNFPPKDKKK